MILLLITLFLLAVIHAYYRLPYWLLSLFWFFTPIFFYLTDKHINNLQGMISMFLILNLIVLFNFKQLRRLLITNRIIQLFNYKENEWQNFKRIDDGWLSTDFEKSIYQGKPDFKSSPELKSNNKISAKFKKLSSQIINYHQQNPNIELSDFIKSLKLAGLLIDKKHGGYNFTEYEQSQITQQISSVEPLVAAIISIINFDSVGTLIQTYGTRDQKNGFLPKLASGEILPFLNSTSLYELLENNQSSIEGRIDIETANGKTLHGIRVSFNDLIMLGLESSTLFYLAINVTDFANELSNKTRLGTALCLFDTKKSNIQIKAGNKAYMGLLKYYRCSAKNIFIPLNQIIGGFNAVNDGIKHLYQLQSNASKIWPSAVSLPIQFQSTFISWYFAHIKKQNGRALLNYRLVRKQLNRQFGHFLRNQLTHQYALSQFNAEQSLSYCNILFKNLVLNDTLKQLGWLRTILGSHAHNIKDQNHMSNFFKVMHLSMELDGDSHEINQLPLMKKVALASHPWYALEIELLTKNQLDTKKLDYYLFKHFGYILHNMAKIWVQTLKTSWLGRLIFRRKKQQNHIRRMSSTFAFIADLSLIKWSLKKESNTEFTGYLAQCNQQLITLMALLNQYQKEETNDARKFILKQSMRDCFFISQTTINQCINSAFGRFSALILKVLIFPLGKPFHQASFSSMKSHVLTDACQLNNAFKMENQLFTEISNTSEKLMSVVTIENAVRNATGSAITTKNHHTLIDRTLAAGIISVDQAEKIRDAYDSILNLQLINHFGQNNEK